MNTSNELSGRLLHQALAVTTRTERVLNGELHAVTDLAREAGFVWPVAVTAAVWAKIQAIPPSQSHQDVTGRLWDVLYMASLAARRSSLSQGLLYRLIMHVGRQTYITLKIVLEMDEVGDPVLTIMLPEEK